MRILLYYRCAYLHILASSLLLLSLEAGGTMYDRAGAQSYMQKTINASSQPQSVKDRLASLAGDSLQKIASSTKSFTPDAIHKMLLDAVAVIKKEQSQPKPQPTFQLQPKHPSDPQSPTKPITQAPPINQYDDVNSIIAEIRSLKAIKQSYDWWDLEMNRNKGRGSDATKNVLEYALNKSEDLTPTTTLTDPDGKEYEAYIERVQKLQKNRRSRVKSQIMLNLRYIDNRLLDRYEQVSKYLIEFAPQGVDRNFMPPSTMAPTTPIEQRKPVTQLTPPKPPAIPSPPKPTSPSGRKDLLSDIRKGKILKPAKNRPLNKNKNKTPTILDQIKNPKPLHHVDESQKVKAETHKSPLLQQIEAGATLKHVDQGKIEKKKKGGLLGTLTSAFKNRFGTRHQLEYEDDNEDDDDWDEADGLN